MDRCNSYLKSNEYESGDTKSDEYQLCCVKNSYCAFYNQIWFIYLSATIGFIIVVCAALSGYLYFQRIRRRRGIEEDASEPTSPDHQNK